MKTKPVYILGTGLSHDGSACILQNGIIKIAIEKERITRIKHDGGNDSAAVQYCLDALGISFSDLSLVVQAANFEKDILPERYRGKRLCHPDVETVTISHHLAHAYSAVATSPFKESNVMVIDGAGSPAAQCDDWPNETVRDHWMSMPGHYCEKDSFYRYADHKMICLQKDFSESKLYDAGQGSVRMPTNYHSIGGLYAAASNYCFGNLDDAGKLMGLAPYGKDTYISNPVFILQDGLVSVDHSQMDRLMTPASDYAMFKQNFQHYADVARWIQKETERAVTYVTQCRMERFPHASLAYAGGVALNAVCNSLLLKNKIAQNLYMQPAAGDNGLSIGCAYYGWNHVLQKEIPKNKNTTVFFGKSYHEDCVKKTLEEHPEQRMFSWMKHEHYIDEVAALLAEGKVIGWFQGGAEFGPRALGHRSILADPRRKDVQHHINANIKFREDFRPFAPAVLKEEAGTYFQHGWDSPYMILIDEIRDEWREQLPGIVHVDGTCRVQTVEQEGNEAFHALLKNFGERSGVAVLVNTSFNKKGMPIVETPREALDFFLSCALDVLVIDQFIVQKNGDVMHRASISS